MRFQAFRIAPLAIVCLLITICRNTLPKGDIVQLRISNNQIPVSISIIVAHTNEKLIDVMNEKINSDCGNGPDCKDGFQNKRDNKNFGIETSMFQDSYEKGEAEASKQLSPEIKCGNNKDDSKHPKTLKMQYGQITNCLRHYTDETQHLKCSLCADNYVSSYFGDTCSKKCHQNFIHFVTFVEVDEEDNVQELKRNICQPKSLFSSLKNCRIATSDSRYINEIRCMECDEGYVPTQGCYENQIFDKIDNHKNFQNDDFGISYSYVECLEKSPKTSFMPSDDFINPLCESYILEQNTFYCHKCKFGYTGKVNRDKKTDIAYIDCDQFVSNCDNDVHYGGSMFDDWLEDMFAISIPYHFTCHKCFDNQIPFVHLSSDYILTPYEVPNKYFSTYKPNESDKNYHTVCKKPTAKNLWVEKENFRSFPQNCALGLYIVNGINKIDLVHSKAYCVACKPGYSREFTHGNFFISNCAPIPNCESDSKSNIWMNYCKSCRYGYAWGFDADNSAIRFDQCIETRINNCLAAKNELECGLCKSGYILSDFKKCKRVENSVCQIFLDIYNKSYNKNRKKIYLEMFFKKFLHDCLSSIGLSEYSYLG